MGKRPKKKKRAELQPLPKKEKKIKAKKNPK